MEMKVAIYVNGTSRVSTVLPLVEEAGCRVDASHEFAGVIYGSIDSADFDKLAKIPGVGEVENCQGIV